jgi:hypothetical protein
MHRVQLMTHEAREPGTDAANDEVIEENDVADA